MVERISGIIHHSFYASKFVGTIVRVVIPVFKDAEVPGRIVKGIPSDIVKEIIVVKEPSIEKVTAIAGPAGVTVLEAVGKGYGKACRRAYKYLENPGIPTDIVVFINADQIVDPRDLLHVVLPIAEENYDLVTGSVVAAEKERKSGFAWQSFRCRVAFAMIRWVYGIKFTDVGTLRAIRFEHLKRLHLKEDTDDWLLGMQVKAARKKLKCREVPLGAESPSGKV